jgi:hypothetical protein
MLPEENGTVMTTGEEHDPDSARFVDRGVTTDLNPVGLGDLITDSLTVPSESTHDTTAPGEPS